MRLWTNIELNPSNQNDSKKTHVRFVQRWPELELNQHKSRDKRRYSCLTIVHHFENHKEFRGRFMDLHHYQPLCSAYSVVYCICTVFHVSLVYWWELIFFFFCIVSSSMPSKPWTRNSPLSKNSFKHKNSLCGQRWSTKTTYALPSWLPWGVSVIKHVWVTLLEGGVGGGERG